MGGKWGLLVIVLFLVGSPLSTAGCWDLQELEDITLAGLAGVDRGSEEGWLRVTVMLQEPAGGAGQTGGGGTVGQAGLRYITVTAEGPTFSLAVQRLNRVTNRLVTFSHTQVLTIGEELAREGLTRVMDPLVRLLDFRRSLRVAVADSVTAQEFLESVRGNIELAPASYVNRLLNTAQVELGESLVVRVHDLVMAYATIGREVVLPLVRLVPKPPEPRPPGSGGTSGSQSGQGGQSGAGGGRGAGDAGAAGGPGEAAPVEKRAEAAGLALFRGDRLVHKLSPEQTQGYLLLVGRFLRGSFTVRGQVTADADLTFQVYRSRREVRVKREGDRVRVTVRVAVEANLQDIVQPVQLVDPENAQLLRSLLAARLEQVTREVVDIAQTRVGGDIFDYYLFVRSTFGTWPEWVALDWPHSFPRAEVVVRVEVTDLRTGLTLQPVRPRD